MSYFQKNVFYVCFTSVYLYNMSFINFILYAPLCSPLLDAGLSCHKIVSICIMS